MCSELSRLVLMGKCTSQLEPRISQTQIVSLFNPKFYLFGKRNPVVAWDCYFSLPLVFSGVIEDDAIP